MQNITGQILKIRKPSRKNVFFDIISDQGSESNEEKTGEVTVVISARESGELVEQSVRGRARLRAGDTVKFRGGWREDETWFAAVGYEVLQTGVSTSPDTPFQSTLPPPLQPGEASGWAPRKRDRHRVTADWLVERFSLQPGGGAVLDIAGGRGDLGFELAAKLGLDCLTVDTRPAKMKSWQTRYLRRHPSAPAPRHLQDTFDTEFFTRQAGAVELGNVALVVGLHPDEATEPIVDTALQLGLRFAVIPCCVFSQQFPDRRLRSGDTPTSYEAFCDYLTEKSCDLSRDTIPFVGKNVVIFKD